MYVFIIAICHAIPSILGALLCKREGLIIGTLIGVLLAFVCGALIFTAFDLIGVALGYFVGNSMISDRDDET